MIRLSNIKNIQEKKPVEKSSQNESLGNLYSQENKEQSNEYFNIEKKIYSSQFSSEISTIPQKDSLKRKISSFPKEDESKEKYQKKVLPYYKEEEARNPKKEILYSYLKYKFKDASTQTCPNLNYPSYFNPTNKEEISYPYSPLDLKNILYFNNSPSEQRRHVDFRKETTTYPYSSKLGIGENTKYLEYIYHLNTDEIPEETPKRKDSVFINKEKPTQDEQSHFYMKESNPSFVPFHEQEKNRPYLEKIIPSIKEISYQKDPYYKKKIPGKETDYLDENKSSTSHENYCSKKFHYLEETYGRLSEEPLENFVQKNLIFFRNEEKSTTLETEPSPLEIDLADDYRKKHIKSKYFPQSCGLNLEFLKIIDPLAIPKIGKISSLKELEDDYQNIKEKSILVIKKNLLLEEGDFFSIKSDTKYFNKKKIYSYEDFLKTFFSICEKFFCREFYKTHKEEEIEEINKIFLCRILTENFYGLDQPKNKSGFYIYIEDFKKLEKLYEHRLSEKMDLLLKRNEETIKKFCYKSDFYQWIFKEKKEFKNIATEIQKLISFSKTASILTFSNREFRIVDVKEKQIIRILLEKKISKNYRKKMREYFIEKQESLMTCTISESLHQDNLIEKLESSDSGSECSLSSAVLSPVFPKLQEIQWDVLKEYGKDLNTLNPDSKFNYKYPDSNPLSLPSGDIHQELEEFFLKTKEISKVRYRNFKEFVKSKYEKSSLKIENNFEELFSSSINKSFYFVDEIGKRKVTLIPKSLIEKLIKNEIGEQAINLISTKIERQEDFLIFLKRECHSISSMKLKVRYFFNLKYKEYLKSVIILAKNYFIKVNRVIGLKRTEKLESYLKLTIESNIEQYIVQYIGIQYSKKKEELKKIKNQTHKYLH